MSLATNWVDNIGMFVNAAYLNQLGNEHNAITHGRPSITTITSSATPAINTDNCTQFNITALATAITSMSSNLSGTPQDGQRLCGRIKDNGQLQTIAWGSSWRGFGRPLPAKTVPGGTLYIEAEYNSADSVWDVLAVHRQLLPVQIVGVASAAAASVTIPAHQPGDLIVIYAFNGSSAAAVTAPAAAGSVPAWASIDSMAGTQCYAMTAQFVATASNHTTGTWTNTTFMVAAVLRGEETSAAAPYGGHALAAPANSITTAISPSVAMNNTDGTSALLYFYGHKNATAWGSAPTGFTQQTQIATSGGVCLDTKNDTTSDGVETRSLTAPAGGTSAMLCAVIEVLAATI